MEIDYILREFWTFLHNLNQEMTQSNLSEREATYYSIFEDKRHKETNPFLKKKPFAFRKPIQKVENSDEL